VKLLKARITNLEKSNEFSKQKLKLQEDELKAKENELKKRDDDISKLKQQKNKILKDLQETQQKLKDVPLKPQKMTLDDLIPTKEHDSVSELDESQISEEPINIKLQNKK